ncbi:malonyl-CoA decarboxylase [Oceanimonas baumannii]|uniref:malonyl-CoA decarboxylase n=1 Tax=Oceanimonas baumannii TaxID=129578 RepID=UPI003A8CA73F
MELNIQFLQKMLSNITLNSRGKAERDGSATGLAPLLAGCAALMHKSGEASLVLRAHEVLQHYAGLNSTEKAAFFHHLASEYAACPATIRHAHEAYQKQPDNQHLLRLFHACEPQRQSLLRQLNLCPGGTYELVKMRTDLQALLQQEPELAALDEDFIHLFSSWFNRGFLVLESIDWNTPAAILEKIIQYEAVHEIRDWHDLRQRLDPADRRCYAFFHPAIGDEPLIFVEVALCKGIPDNVQHILTGGNQVSPEQADTAVFYSISNCQSGLKGISFGNFLIKQVVQELSRELPSLKQFVTLSPVPGFTRWLKQQGTDQLQPALTEQLEPLAPGDKAQHQEIAASLQTDLLALAAHYLTEVKSRHGFPMDPVARFHLGNGASLHRLNWLADNSAKGLSQSHGIMVNYLYELDRIEQNHEALSQEGKVICTTDIRRLAKRAQGLLAKANAA